MQVSVVGSLLLPGSGGLWVFYHKDGKQTTSRQVRTLQGKQVTVTAAVHGV